MKENGAREAVRGSPRLSASQAHADRKLGRSAMIGRAFSCSEGDAISHVVAGVEKLASLSGWIYYQNHCGCSSMVEQKLPKLKTRVRFPSPAPSLFVRHLLLCASNRLFIKDNCRPLPGLALLWRRMKDEPTRICSRSATLMRTAQ